MERQSQWHWVFFWGFAAILLLPLLNIPPLFSPPAWGQTIAFRLVFIPLFLFFLWQLLKTRALSLFIPHGPAKLPWVLLYALGGVLLIATFFSADPLRSFWDDPSRAWGALNYLLYIAFAVVLFLVLKAKEWQRLWYVLLGTGVGLSLLAVFQNFGLFGGTLISYGRPVATLGNPIFLAMALVPLTIMAMVWFSHKRGMKRAAFAAAILLFLYALFLTLSRAGFLGLTAGLTFFLLFAPSWRKTTKIGIVAVVLAGAFLLWYANVAPELPAALEFLPNAETLWSRLSLESALQDPRFAAWGLALEATAQRPLLGWGPSNASLAIDRFYDSSISELHAAIGWWDTSHNIFVDLLVETGVLGLGAFLAFLATLFYKLQQARRRNPELRLQIIGMQAAFLGYFTNALFAFNTFATFLVFFFLVAYSLHLISQGKQMATDGSRFSQIPSAAIRYQSVVIGVLAIASAWFLWQHNLAPLWVNKEMNVAVFLAQSGQCQQAIQRIEGLSSPSPSLDYYLPAQYTNVVRACLPPGSQDPEGRVLLALKGAELLDEAASARPQYSRTYFTKADYLNIALSYLAKGEGKDALAQEVEATLKKAQELSPGREDFYEKGARTASLLGQYDLAIDRANQCLEYDSLATKCLWEKVVAHIYQEDLKAADQVLEEIIGLRALTFAEATQLAALYEDKGHYDRLAMPYARLVAITEDPRYASSLALVYKKLGHWDGAHETTLLILEWDPDLRGQVEEFLQPIRESLQQECRQGKASSCWRLSLVELTLGNPQQAAETKARATTFGFPVSSPEALNNLIEVYLANNDIPGLLAVYEQFPDPASRPVGALLALADRHQRGEKYEEARELAKLAQELNPTQAKHAQKILDKLPK